MKAHLQKGFAGRCIGRFKSDLFSISALLPDSRYRGLVPLVALFLTLISIQSAIVFGNRTLIPLIGGNSTSQGSPYGYTGPSPNWTTTSDPSGGLNFSYADDIFTAQQMREGGLPFWNPYQGLGHPFLANNLSAPLYPINWLIAILPPSLFDIVYLLNWFLFAVFLALYLGELGISRWYAVVGAMPLLVSGQMQINLPLREIGASGAWFGLLLYGIERGLREPAWRWRHVVISGAFYCTVSGGQQQIAFLSLFTASIYAAVRICQHRTGILRRLFALAPGFLAGLLLSTPVWLTFAEYLPMASTTHTGYVDGPYHLPIESLSTFFFPFSYGRVQTYPMGRIAEWTWNRSPGWSQAACLFLVLASARGLLRDRPRGLVTLWVIAFLAGGKIWGLPGINAIGSLPIFNLIKFPCYSAFLLDFALAGLAVYGLRSLCPRETKWLPLALAWVGLLLLVLFVSFRPIWTQEWNIEIKAFVRYGVIWAFISPLGLWWVHLRRPGEERPFLIAAAAGILLQGISTISYGYTVPTYALLSKITLVAFVTLMLALGLFRLRPVVFGGLLLIVVCGISFGVASKSPQGLARRFNILQPSPPYITFLHRGLGDHYYRSISLDGVLEGNFAAPFGISSVNVFEGMLPLASKNFNQQLLDRNSNGIFFGHFGGPEFQGEFRTNRKFFDLVGVKYIVSGKTDPNLPPMDDRSMPVVYSERESGIRIWENLRAFPRVFLAPKVVQVSSVEAAFDAMRAAPDLRSVVWVEPPDGIDLKMPDAPLVNDSREFGTLLNFRLQTNEAWITYKANRPGVLVMTDSYAAGWIATLNGQDVPILRANGALRGIQLLGPGNYEIHMRYRPPHWNLILLFIMLGAALLFWR
jgi:hypothetical protein